MAGDELAPFSGKGGWVGSPHGRPPQITWIQQHSIALPEAHRNALLYCESAAEMRLILPLCTLSDWVADADKVFTNGRFTVTLQEEIGPYRADFVFRSEAMARPLVIEVDGPAHYSSRAVAHDRTRTDYLERLGFDVRHVASDEAGAAGAALRKEFARDQIAGFAETSGRSRAVLKQEWRWPPAAGVLAYGVVGLSRDERRAPLAAWLKHRKQAVPEQTAGLLTICDDAAEIEFVLPFLKLPNVEIVEDSVVMGPYVLFLGQGEGSERMDVVLTLDVGDGFRAIVFDIDPLPFVGVDRMAVAAKQRRWQENGFSVEPVQRSKAGEVGCRVAGNVGRILAESYLGASQPTT